MEIEIQVSLCDLPEPGHTKVIEKMFTGSLIFSVNVECICVTIDYTAKKEKTF